MLVFQTTGGDGQRQFDRICIIFTATVSEFFPHKRPPGLSVTWNGWEQMCR